MKIEVTITNDSGCKQTHDVTHSPYMNCILQAHHDSDGILDGGLLIQNGIIVGHIDPSGPKGNTGESGKSE